MKIIILFSIIALVLVSCRPVKYDRAYLKDRFAERSPVNFTTERQMGPVGQTQDKINLFVKLISDYIPALADLSDRSTSLEIRESWHFLLFGIHIVIRWEFELDVGWTVKQEEVAGNSLKITYTPFAFGHTYLWNDVNYYNFVEFFIDPFFQFLNTSIPIEITINGDGSACLSADFHLAPGYFYNYFTARAQDCKSEILDELISQHQVLFHCHWIEDFETTLNTIQLHPEFMRPLFDICFTT